MSTGRASPPLALLLLLAAASAVSARSAMALPATARCLKSTLKGYRAMVTLKTGLVFHFNTTTTSLNGAIEAKGASFKNGWLAVGFSAAGKMSRSDAVVGNLGAPAPVLPYYMGSTMGSSVVKTTKFKLTKTAVSTGASTIVRFTRTSTGGAGTVRVKYNGVNYMLWAHAPSNSKVLGYHMNKNRGAWSVNFACKV